MAPEGVGTIGCLINFVIGIVVSRCTAAPSEEIQQIVEEMRLPELQDG